VSKSGFLAIIAHLSALSRAVEFHPRSIIQFVSRSLGPNAEWPCAKEIRLIPERPRDAAVSIVRPPVECKLVIA